MKYDAALREVEWLENQLRGVSEFSRPAAPLMGKIDAWREILRLPARDWDAWWRETGHPAAGPANPLTQSRLRAAVWDKTGGRCWYCGAQTNPFRDFAIDHQRAQSQGGTDTLDNLVPACRSCNTRKNNRSVDYLRRRLGRDNADLYRFYGETLIPETGDEG